MAGKIKKRGKCIFNDELAKKYSFIQKQKGKGKSDVHCMLCNADFSIEYAGKTDIERHMNTSKH